MNIAAAAEQAGIVGAGGAGFPTHVKLNAKADTVIVNGAECEPLLRVDQQLMKVYADNLLCGLDLIVEHVGANKGVVALKAHYHEAVLELKKSLKNHPKLSIFEMGSFYPAGDEQVIVAEVTGRIVPEGGIPLNVGAIVTNVETVLNVFAASVNQTPVTEKYFTVTGAVKNPKTIKVPIGMSMQKAIDLAGGCIPENYAIISGGPMMGKVVPPDTPITKTDKGLIVLPAGHPVLNSIGLPLDRIMRDAQIACMQCSLCTEVCPRANLGHRLAPHKNMRLAAYGSLCDKQETPMNAFLCCDCRLCEYACVMNLQPWKLNKALKQTLSEKGVKNTLNAKPDKASPFRELKRYPVSKLITQLGLDDYNVTASLVDELVDVKKVVIPIKQHIGAPSNPTVKVGDFVKKGVVIATIPEGKMGANIHSSIDGKIIKVTDAEIVIAK